jgi:hypothetical protein
MELRPVLRQQWSDEEGYTDSDEVLGYAALDARGLVLAYGETPSEAMEAGLEAQWLVSRQSEEDSSSSAAVAR